MDSPAPGRRVSGRVCSKVSTPCFANRSHGGRPAWGWGLSLYWRGLQLCTKDLSFECLASRLFWGRICEFMWGLLEWAPGASGGCRGRLSLVYGGNILGHFTTWLGGPGMALQLLSSGRNVLFSLALAGPAETGLARPPPHMVVFLYVCWHHICAEECARVPWAWGCVCLLKLS